MQATSGSRATVLAAVALLHVAALGVLLHQRSAAARPLETGTAIEVSLIQMAQADPDPIPPIKPVLIEQAIRVPTPEVTLTIPVEQAMTVAVIEKPRAAPQPATAAPRTITPADYLRPLQVQYPRSARQTRQQGVVTLLVSIDADGRPVRVEVARSSGHAALDRAAVEAARAALFRPFVDAGVAQSVQVLVPVEFSISERVAKT